MDINDMTYGQLKEIGNIFSRRIGETRIPFSVGDKLLIRTCTHYYLGRVEEITGDFLKLVEASWVQDTGRFYDVLKDGIVESRHSEIEPCPEYIFVNTTAIVDASPWRHELPKEQK